MDQIRRQQQKMQSEKEYRVSYHTGGSCRDRLPVDLSALTVLRLGAVFTVGIASVKTVVTNLAGKTPLHGHAFYDAMERLKLKFQGTSREVLYQSQLR